MKSLAKVCTSAAIACEVCCLFLFTAPTLAQNRIALVGSGSNVPSRLYAAWTDEFNKKNSNIQVRYISMSTMEGIKQISGGSGDFAGGEIPLTREEMHGLKVSLVQIPSVLVGIVPVYNLPGNPELNFSGEALAQIFLGTIKNWKDPRLAKLNSGVSLPDLPLKVVHRTGGKGSNYIFTDFLSKVSSDWRSKVGKSASPDWPVGDDANRGEDMVAKVVATSGAVGYVELNFARSGEIGYGSVQNAAGEFVRATPESIRAACATLEKSIPSDFRVSLVNAPGKDSYALASFTWLYVPTSGLTAERTRALKQFLKWALEDGQNLARTLGYATLPASILSKAQATVETIP